MYFLLYPPLSLAFCYRSMSSFRMEKSNKDNSPRFTYARPRVSVSTGKKPLLTEVIFPFFLYLFHFFTGKVVYKNSFFPYRNDSLDSLANTSPGRNSIAFEDKYLEMY